MEISVSHLFFEMRSDGDRRAIFSLSFPYEFGRNLPDNFASGMVKEPQRRENSAAARA
jgi:hypothetical protein